MSKDDEFIELEGARPTPPTHTQNKFKKNPRRILMW